MSENSAKHFNEKIRENIKGFYFFLNMNDSKGRIAIVVIEIVETCNVSLRHLRRKRKHFTKILKKDVHTSKKNCTRSSMLILFFNAVCK